MKRFFTDRGIEYVENGVTVDEKARQELTKVVGRFAIPTIVIGKEVLLGCAANRARNREDTVKRKTVQLGSVLFALVVAACGQRDLGSGPYDSNGERIYLSGTSANGRVSYSEGEVGGGMMGGQGMMSDQLACADCHGPAGRGGPHVMHMTAMDAPDIRWSALTEAEHGEEEEMEHPPYDEETFKRAVTQGLDPGGDPLDSAMPRWRISEQDLDDLIAFLQGLD